MTKYTYIAIGVALIGMVLVVVITMLTLVVEKADTGDSTFVTIDFNSVSVRSEVVETYFEIRDT